MKEYIKLFATHSEYNAAKDDLDKPNVACCIDQNEVHYNPIPKPDEQYLTFEILSGGTLTWNKYNGTRYARTIYYSTDNGNQWNELNNYSSNVSIDVDAGDKLIFKGNNNSYGGYSDYERYSHFGGTSTFNAYGNIMSLIYGDNFYEKQYEYPEDIDVYEGLFFGLFNGANVVSAKKLILPLLELRGENDYGWMFGGCSLLIEAPKLPATTLAKYCYNGMFEYCSTLTTAPNLPATTLADSCYYYMFGDCTALTTAPALPATTLAQDCYDSMFQGCTALTTAPELPATTLANYCYNYMFENCRSLTTAPELPATTLISNCYNAMFKGCTSLTTAPELPATTLVKNCYDNMFYGCSNLNYIKAMFTTTPSATYTKNWVSGVSATGTFVKNSAAQWDVSGDNGIPSGWTVQTAIS